MKWIREIKAVGFKDWFWFVFILKRNEFSEKLSLMNYYDKFGNNEYQYKLLHDRNKAHNIELKLFNINNFKFIK